MLGHTVASYLINGIIIFLVGLGIHNFSYYWLTKPNTSWIPVITLVLLSAFTVVLPFGIGYVFSFLVSGYLIYREHNLYKLGAVAFLIAVLLTTASLIIGKYTMIVIPFRWN